MSELTLHNTCPELQGAMSYSQLSHPLFIQTPPISIHYGAFLSLSWGVFGGSCKEDKLTPILQVRKQRFTENNSPKWLKTSYAFSKRFSWKSLCVSMLCRHVCLRTICMAGAWGGKETELDPENRSSGAAVSPHVLLSLCPIQEKQVLLTIAVPSLQPSGFYWPHSLKTKLATENFHPEFNVPCRTSFKIPSRQSPSLFVF